MLLRLSFFKQIQNKQGEKITLNKELLDTVNMETRTNEIFEIKLRSQVAKWIYALPREDDNQVIKLLINDHLYAE